MLQKFLKDSIGSIVGKPAEEVVTLLDGKKYTNEFLIAKKLDLTINQTRNILYKISDYGLVSFIRKKDKRKGWYTYFWKIEIVKCLEFFKLNILKKMEQIKFQIRSRETKEFYECVLCHIEFTEENALVHDFMCNECGNILSRKDNSPVIKEYSRELAKLEKELSLVEEELKTEKEKVEKTKIRALKKEEAKKKEARAKARISRKKEKEEMNKKIPKKIVKKTVVKTKVKKKILKTKKKVQPKVLKIKKVKKKKK
jgi:transcription factor E